MKKINRFEDLEIWQKAVKIAVEVYQHTQVGALKNDFGMKDQLQRSAMSISNNIAEGFEYNNNKNFIRFLRYSKASCSELRSQLFVVSELNFIQKNIYENWYEQLISLSKQISGFIKYLKEFEKKKTNTSDN